MDSSSAYARDVHLASLEDRVILCEYLPSHLDGTGKDLLLWTSPHSRRTYVVHDLNAEASCVITSPSESSYMRILAGYKNFGRAKEGTQITLIRPGYARSNDDGDELGVPTLTCTGKADYYHVLHLLYDLERQAHRRKRPMRKMGCSSWAEMEEKYRQGKIPGGVPPRKIVILDNLHGFLSDADGAEDSFDMIRLLIHQACPVGIHLVVVNAGVSAVEPLMGDAPQGVWVTSPYHPGGSFSSTPRDILSDSLDIDRPHEVFRVEQAPLTSRTTAGRVCAP